MNIRLASVASGLRLLKCRTLFMATANTPTLLFVTDFSDSSVHAMHWAMPEAQKHNLHLAVLYPYRLDKVHRKENSIQSKKELEREATEKFELLAENLLKHSHVTYDFKAEVGFLRDRVSEYSRKHNVVLLVIGQRMINEESFAEMLDDLQVPLVIIPASR